MSVTGKQPMTTISRHTLFKDSLRLVLSESIPGQNQGHPLVTWHLILVTFPLCPLRELRVKICGFSFSAHWWFQI